MASLRAPLRRLSLHCGDLTPFTGGCESLQRFCFAHMQLPPRVRLHIRGTCHKVHSAAMSSAFQQSTETVAGLADANLASLVAAADQFQHLEKLELRDLQVGQQPRCIADTVSCWACVRLLGQLKPAHSMQHIAGERRLPAAAGGAASIGGAWCPTFPRRHDKSWPPQRHFGLGSMLPRIKG